ncbi:amino acid adenylation domain-containing protein [Paenibacillus jamilae]|uniref:amino acid adenylation domain-containing protein n=1 Tax=Paenibacillus jamilae TaxID=114136 RepID=UPI003D2B080D
MNKGLEIEKVANLTPLQEGMLIHALMEPESHAYYEQLRISIRGELNWNALQKSFQLLVQRHEILRSNIYHKSASRSRLIVFEKRTTAITYENMTGMNEREQAEAISQFMDRDRNNHYDLSRDMLIRLAVLQTDKDAYTLLLSFHHIIMDGWCLGVIMDEILTAYEAYHTGCSVQLPEPRPYTVYADWLEEQDQQATKDYWNSVLQDYEQTAGLTMLKTPATTIEKEGYLLQEYKTTLSEKETHSLRTFAERNGATLSSLFLAAWGIVLGGYNRSKDVVFGTVVSGRPSELDEVERIVGLFINTIPLRIRLHEEKTFAELLRDVQRASIQGRANGYCSLAEIQSQSALKQQLLDHIVVFENYPLENMVGRRDWQDKLGFIIEDAKLFEEIPYDFNIEVEDKAEMSFILSYNAKVYNCEAMKLLANHLEHVLLQIAGNPDVFLHDLRLLTTEEETKLVETWSGPVVQFPALTFHGIFEAQAEQTPEQAAVIYEDTMLTYKQLNDSADCLAHFLQKRGITRESLVAVMVDRSVEMIIAVLGIMKAGAAYVPVDPAYPEERIAYMLRDCGTSIVLTQSHLTDWIKTMDFKGEVVDLATLPLQSGLNSDKHISIYEPNSLAYVIYTSGTTGKPKGVMVEHQQYVNTALGYRHSQGFKDFSVKLLQIASMSFDVFACDLAKAFVNGGTLVICPENVRNDPAALATLLEQQEITTFEVPPVLLALLLHYIYEHGTNMSSFKLLTTGADSLAVTDYRTMLTRFGSKLRIINTYGVTEAAIESSFYEGELEKLPLSGIVPIGRALPNHKLYIVDDMMRPVPIGVTGELCIGGASVARGYLNRPELTAEKFVSNPFVPGGRMYRTGDLARWLPDGNIDFIGRADYQYKIRGYRIEPGEIESILLETEGVRQAVVVDRLDKAGQKYLCAYVAGVADKDMLRDKLAQQLPVYMVPAQIIVLEQLPLTHNGKIDRSNLPEPDEIALLHSAYEAPQDELEKTIATIWEEVIGVKPIGLHNNFFELGGDSIKALQIAIRLNAKGLKMEVKDLFRNPEIQLIAPFIKKITRIIPQGIVEGEVELTPVQFDFFQHHRGDRHHFNQAVMLQNDRGWNELWLKNAMDKLVAHHDALRLIFVEEEHGVSAYNRGVNEGEFFTLTSYDLTQSSQPEEDIRNIGDELQSSLDLQHGPLIRMALFHLIGEDHLMIVMHHLIVDGVSWRILLEDLGTAYNQVARGEMPSLPAKTDAYKEWSSRLTAYAESAQARQEIGYWNNVESRKIRQLPRDHEIQISLIQDQRLSEVALNRDETEKLLKQVHHAYHTEMNDLLLTALGLAFHEWSGYTEIPILLEGHGREGIIKDLDISRTVGWFTSLYPVVIEVHRPENLAYQIKMVKDKLRRVPNKGIGYGILRYLTKEQTKSASLVAAPVPPEISFNYLGQFDEENSADMPWRISQFADLANGERSLRAEKVNTFDINGMITNGILRFGFEYNGLEYEIPTVERLTASFKKHLLNLIHHCCTKDQAERSPTDFTYSHLSMGQFEHISSRLSDKLGNLLK